jgi:hypothetical protein
MKVLRILKALEDPLKFKLIIKLHLNNYTKSRKIQMKIALGKSLKEKVFKEEGISNYQENKTRLQRDKHRIKYCLPT